MGENGLSVNVLQYADDTLIFSRPDSDKVVNMGRILRCFQLISGLKINFGKSRLSGIGVDEQVLQIWADLLHCSIESLPCNYLGLPLGANPRSKNIWQPVIDRFNSRLSRWKGSQLSMAGRVTLIKSVLSSLPTYYMSLFLIPQGVRESLEKIQRNFLWNGTAEKRKMHLVDWKSICSPKKLGGLGIADLKIKNRALLNKWLWRFSEEEDSYWRKVIVEKYNIQNNSLLPLGINKRRCSNLWWKIIEPVYVENPDFNKVKDGLRMEVGDGALINFWDDWWLKELVLEAAFPRIYALAKNKKGKIVEYGEWSEDRWVWRVQLRRNLFDWELNQWEELLALLDNVSLYPNFKDKLIWKYSSFGKYTAKDFFNFVCLQNYAPDSIWHKIWLGLAPPKVETFLWQVIRGRIAIKTVLNARGLIAEENTGCPICNEFSESIDHLFLKCKRSWLLWLFFCAKWKVSWVIPDDMCSAFLSWLGISMNSVWRVTFYAILWTLWMARNDAVFNGKVMETAQLCDLVGYRVAYWCKAKWPDGAALVDDYMRFPDCIQTASRGGKVLPRVEWVMPEVGQLKFNVDGAARGQPGEAGIGGVLRDENGSTRLVFSKSIGLADSNMVELLAIKEAFLIFSASDWVNEKELLIETDSRNAAKWVNDPASVPWRFRQTIFQIEGYKKKIRRWIVRHVFREANSMADNLAKSSIDRGSTIMTRFD